MKEILDTIECLQKQLLERYISTEHRKYREKISQQILILDTILYKTCEIYAKYETNLEALKEHLYDIYTSLECMKSGDSRPTSSDIDIVIKKVDDAMLNANNL